VLDGVVVVVVGKWIGKSGERSGLALAPRACKARDNAQRHDDATALSSRAQRNIESDVIGVARSKHGEAGRGAGSACMEICGRRYAQMDLAEA
jgi:hypothetical protein